MTLASLILLASGVAGSVGSTCAVAQEFPQREIRIVISLPPGGGGEDRSALGHRRPGQMLDPGLAEGRAAAEAFVLGLYRFDRHKSKRSENTDKEFGDLLVVEHDSAKLSALQQGVETGTVIAQAEPYNDSALFERFDGGAMGGDFGFE